MAFIERMKFASWYAFVFLLPWQTVWIAREVLVAGEKWQYATVGLSLSDAVLLVFSFCFLLSAPRETLRAMLRDGILRILLALLVWSLLSTLWAERVDMALLGAARVFLLTLAFVGVRYGGAPIRKTLGVFVFSVSIHAMLAMWQWVGQAVPASSLFGIAEHDPARWGTSVLKTDAGRFLRAYGGFEHPNVLGGALAISAFFSIWLGAGAKRVRSRAFFLFLSALFGFALVYTFSRSAWMAFGVGLFIFLSGGFFPIKKRNFFCASRGSTERNIFLNMLLSIGTNIQKKISLGLAKYLGKFSLKESRLCSLSPSRRRGSRFHQLSGSTLQTFFVETKYLASGDCLPAGRQGFLPLGGTGMTKRDSLLKKTKRNIYRVLFVALVPILSFSVAFFLVHDIAMSRFSGETLAREGSLTDRAAYMEQALVAIREHPMLGVGGGNFTAFARERFPEFGRFIGDFQPVHMVPILVFAELGAIGFVLFSLLSGVVFLRAWRDRNLFGIAILCALLPLLLLDHFLWTAHFGAVFLGFALGAILHPDFPHNPKKQKNQK